MSVIKTVKPKKVYAAECPYCGETNYIYENVAQVAKCDYCRKEYQIEPTGE